MQVLLISNKVPWPPHDGGAIASLNMCKNLSEEGHAVCLLAMNTSKHPLPAEALPEWMHTKINTQLVPVNTRIRPLKALLNLLFSDYPYNYSRFISKRFRNLLISILREKKFDIVQFEGLPLIWYARQVRRYSGAHLVLRAHNVEHQIWKKLAAETHSRFRRGYYNVLYKRILKLERNLEVFDGIICISQKDQAGLQGLGCKQKSTVVWTGYTVDRTVSPKAVNIPPKVYYIGALDWLPNQEGLLWFLEHVWQNIISRKPESSLYIAGRNAPERLETKIQSYPVNYMGEVSDAKAFASDKDILIVPLFSGSGIRIKIIEAMGMGKTVITTPLGAEGLPVQDGKDLLICRSEADFTRELLNILLHPERVIAIAREAVNTIRTHFDNKTLAKNVSNFYKSL